MALETGVQIKLEVTGEQLLKQAFESVKIAARGLETQGLSLGQTLKKLEGFEKETIKTFRKSSDTYKGLQKETVTLAKQYEFMAKFSGISAKEARFLAVAQDDLIKKSKELNIHGAARNSFIESQNKKIVEQIRLNNQLTSSINAVSGSYRTAVVEIDKVEKELKKLQTQSELIAKDQSTRTASGVVRLQDGGATKQEIDKFIQLRKQIENLDPVVTKTTLSCGGLTAVARQNIPTVGAIGIGSALTQTTIACIRTADSMSLLKNRMKLVISETQNFDQVYSGLVQTSINNRASLSDTVTLFNRLVPALRANGVEASLATTVVDSFQKTLLISGATVRETSSAMLQLSQAFAAGRLNGDEFRSISEAAPEFLRTFSKATGIAAGALKELASDGKLTTEVLVAAMVVMNAELTKTAAGIDITFGQSVQILGTRLSVLVDVINETTGFTKLLADSTFQVSEVVKGFSQFLKENADSVRFVTTALGESIKIASIALSVFAGLKLLMAGLSLAGGVLTGVLFKLGQATASYALGATSASIATGFLATAMKSLMSSTGIGALLVVLGTAAIYFSDFIFGADESSKAIEKQTEASKVNAKELEKAQAVLKNFGILNTATSESSKAYEKEIRSLTNAYIEQKVNAEGLYLIRKNLLELERSNLVSEANKIQKGDGQYSELDQIERSKRIAGIVKEKELLDDLLGVLALTEEQRKQAEAAANARKGAKSAAKDLEREAKAAKEAAEAYSKLGYEEVFKQREKNLDSILKNVDSTEEEIKQLNNQTDSLLLSKEALFEKEIATIDAAIATAELALTEELAKNETTALTFALQDQIDVLNKLKQAKNRNDEIGRAHV